MQLEYLLCVLKESLRLRPSVPMRTRDLAVPMTLLAQPLPAGAIVGFSAFVIHHDPEVWPEPDVFDPSRFQEDENGVCHSPRACRLDKELAKYAHLGFGAGPRRCIGEPMSLLEARAALAYLVRNFKFRLAEGQTDACEVALTLRPKNGMRMYVARRAAVAT